MAQRKLPIFQPNYMTLTKCEILVDHDPDTCQPTRLTYNKQTPIYIDVNEIVAVTRKFDPYDNVYLPVCMLILKNAFQVDQSSFGLHVTNSYSQLVGILANKNCDDLCDSGCNCFGS